MVHISTSKQSQYTFMKSIQIANISITVSSVLPTKVCIKEIFQKKRRKAEPFILAAKKIIQQKDIGQV